MADNRYRQYLEQEQHKQEKRNSANTALGFGMAIGAGATAFRFRKQIKQGATVAGDFVLGSAGNSAVRMARSRALRDGARKAGSYIRAVDNALDGTGSAGPLALITQKGRNKFNRRLEDSLSASYRAIKHQMADPVLHNAPLKIESSFDQMIRGVQIGRKGQLKQLKMDKIHEKLQKEMPEKMFENLRAILNDQKDEFFSDPKEERIKGLIEKYTRPTDGSKYAYQHSLDFESGTEKDAFVSKMLDTLKTYKDESNFNKKTLREQQKKVGDVAIDEFKKSHQKRETFLSKMMERVGFRNITMKDVMDRDLMPSGGALEVPTKDGGHRRGMRVDRLKNWAKSDGDIKRLVADDKVFINSAGDIADFRGIYDSVYRGLSIFRESVQVPFLRFNPLDLLHFSTFQAQKEAPSMYLLRRGTIDPLLGATKNVQTMKHPMAHNQDAAVGTLAREYMFMNGSVYDLGTMDKVKENVYLGSARFGMVPRALSGMSNLHRQDYSDRKGVMGAILNAFDLGKQESDSIYKRGKTVITKFDNPDWERNQFRRLRMMQETGYYDLSDAESIYRNTYNLLEQKTTRLSDEVADFLDKHVRKAYGDIDIDLKRLNTDQEVMEALGRLHNAMSTPNKAIAVDEGLRKQIEQQWKAYKRNPTESVKGKRVRSAGTPELPESISFIDGSETDLVSSVEDARRLIHQHAARQLQYADGNTAADLVREGIRSNILTSNDLKDVRNLESLTVMRQWWDDVYKGSSHDRSDALKNFVDLAGNKEKSFSQALKDTIDDFTPFYSTGPGDKPPQPFGYVGYVTVNKTRGYQSGIEEFNKNLASGQGYVKSGVKAAWSVLGQPFAGRRNLDDVTGLTLGSYYMTERLDNAFAKIGLGLSQRNRGSMQSIIGNQLGRRVVLPMVVLHQAQYLNDVTGGLFSDQAADAYVNMHQDVAWMKEMFGLNNIIGKSYKMFDGLDQIHELPFMKAFNFATFGLLSDSRDHEELKYYYESGEDPVRKGRYWGMGSNTPWMGGKIDRYEPNWYRKLKSDWKYQDNTYGSPSEYYANHWIPTLTNPIAPLTYLAKGHNHYEKKLMEERPYAIYGGVNEIEQLPIIGAPLNATIGRIISPQYKHKDLEKSHRAYIEEINNYYASQYEAAGRGGTVEFLPGGGYSIGAGDVGGGYGGYGDPVNVGPSYDVGSYGVGSGGGRYAVNDVSRADLTAINYGLANGGSPVRSITSLDSLRDPDIVAELSDIGTVGSIPGIARDSFYSASEIGGIYGFGVKALTGFEESGRGMVLEPSSRMSSYARAWWDLEMGSLDFASGQFSEIFRRYVPRDPNRNYWNPIRNKMPDWLPGVEYFTDFKHGDPYVKIPKGEIRLPGAAYESLYKLHPDAFGDYGAFDRFRILADVAPYSENYKFYRRVVSQMNQEGMLTEGMKREYADIRDQVSERKKKFNFYDRKFRDSDIKVESVTVSHVIDANTFLTKEYGWDNPIKLSGVHINADDEEAQDFVSQFIYSGARIKIGLDADPLARVRDDSIDSMHAVVFTGNSEEGTPFYMSNKGQNLNNMLANRSFGGFMGVFGENNITVKHDGSATATHAIFSQDQITVGKIWESISHDILPNLPAIGPLFDKFLQVRSPLEQYKRVEVYGKAWRPWDQPIEGWIKPMLDTITERHPLVATAQGAGIGWLASRAVGRKWIVPGMAIATGMLSSMRVFSETAGAVTGKDDTWLPERRHREREINEYFDRLKYVKYKGLYEKAAEIAKRREGIDIDSILSESEERGRKNKSAQRYLETQKKYLSISNKLGYGDEEEIRERLDSVRDGMSDIESRRGSMQLGPHAMLAMRYRAEYESTLYGADPNGDMQKIFRALPAKDREFFTEFMNASPRDREEILRLVPKDQRKFYQARWGLKIDEPESLRSYFSRNYLPDENWEGWSANTSLDSIKLKVVQNEGLEMTEFGFWSDDEKRAKEAGAQAINTRKISHNIDVMRLEKILRGAGLNDVSITMTTGQAQQNKVDLAMNLMRDRSREIVHELNNNLGGIFS